MLDTVTSLLGLSGGIVALVGFLTSVVLFFWLPFMAWSVTRNVKGIHQQLARLNDNLESRPASSSTNRFVA